MARKDRSNAPGIVNAAPAADIGNGGNNSEFPGNSGQGSELPNSTGSEPIDPTTAEPGTTSTSSIGNGRNRNRTRRSGNTENARESRAVAKREKQKETAKDLGVLIASTHYVLATLTKCNEMNLSEDESTKLGEALARVSELYGDAVISPKVAAMGNLIMVASGIYVPRFIAIRNNAKKQKPATQTQLKIVDAERPPN